MYFQQESEKNQITNQVILELYCWADGEAT